jgi:pimeloyl-ACP methyl ester carboxylesterase
MNLSQLKSDLAVAPSKYRRKLVVAAVAAAAAAATALWVRHKARQAERDNPPQGEFVEVDGVRLHYLDRGDGPAVILLHGNGMVSQDFVGSGLVDLLAARYRVIVFDRPGYGYSERPRDRVWTPAAQAAVLNAAVARLGLERPVVVGHSWGAMVAAAWGLDFPADVRGLVLLSGYYYPTVRPDVLLFGPPAIPIVGDLMRYTLSPLAMRASFPMMARHMFAPGPVATGFEAEVPREMLLRPVQIRASAEESAFALPAAIAMKDRYAGLRMPVKIIAGEKDSVVGIDGHSVRLHDEVPGSSLTLVPGVGHMVHYFASWKAAGAVDEIYAAEGGTGLAVSSLPELEAAA